jgi:hypothetical protein
MSLWTEPPSEEPCARCGRETATGLAFIDNARYCHGDFDIEPTCYELSSRELYGLYTFPLDPVNWPSR